MGEHSIAEVFAALTRLPVQPRIHPVEAARIISENILPHFEVVSLGKEDYLEAVNTMARGGWSGAKMVRRSPAVLRVKVCSGAHLYLQSRGFQAVGRTRSARKNLRAISQSESTKFARTTAPTSDRERRVRTKHSSANLVFRSSRTCGRQTGSRERFCGNNEILLGQLRCGGLTGCNSFILSW